MPEPVAVVGLIGGECFGTAARAAIDGAQVLVGSPRQLDLVGTAGAPDHAERVVLGTPLDDVLDTVAARRECGAAVCVLASGDPGFFGIVRALGERLGRDALAVHPAPSSIALAFARLGASWDDAAVVSAHGRPRADAVAHVARAATAAVLTSPDNPPEAVAAALVDAGQGGRAAAVLTRIGEVGEARFDGDVRAVATRTFDPMSILVVLPADADTPPMGLSWGLPEDTFAHRDGMITKAEVRAIALGKLALPPAGVLWDVGAGSGAVGIEAARIRPGMHVVAVESDPESADRIEANARTHGVGVEVVRCAAPATLAGLPDPDRAFVGGGGIEVLDAVLARLRPGGVVVANYTLVDRAVQAWHRLGNVVQVAVAHGRGTGTGDELRLAAENPVFVCWGPA